MSDLAKLLIAIGLFMVVIGVLILLFGNIFSWFGRLPGDIHIDKGNVKVFIPFTSMILLSLVLSLVINVILRMLNK